MPRTCPVCSMGHLAPTGAPYMQILNGTLIQAPMITAWKCDICGESFFDGQAVRRLETLIGETGPPPNHYAPPPTAIQVEQTESSEPDSVASIEEATKALQPRSK